MKKKLLAVSSAAVLVLSVALLGACADKKVVEDNVTLKPAQASAPTVKSGELVNVTPDAAIDVALGHAGVARENAVLHGAPSLDDDDRKPHYDVEFSYNGFEYDYEVAVSDGAVLKAEKETEKVNAPVNGEPEKTEATVKPANDNNGYISVEEAKQRALDDAGVKAEDTVFLKAHYDADDMVPHFDVKFKAGDYEYEYEIKAADGAVLEKDVDKERNSAGNASTQNEYITADEAKAKAFEHASVKAADVKYAKAELDRDDMVVHYDVEFVSGKYEYEYEVNAETGKVIAFDKEFNDR